MIRCVANGFARLCMHVHLRSMCVHDRCLNSRENALTNVGLHWYTQVKEGLLAAALKKLELKKLWDKQTVALALIAFDQK